MPDLKTFKSRNPATGEVFASHPQMSDDQMNIAIDRCHAAFGDWRLRSLQERAQVIGKIGEALSAAKDELATLMTREMGKLLKHAKQEVDLCAAICEYTAETGPQHLADDERKLPGGGRGIVTFQPIGVVYGIQPWNFPAYQVVRYSIASLMAGNGVLLKHAGNVTGSAKKLAEIYESAGLPEHLFTVLVIDHDQSDAVIAHDKVRGVTLTGSTDAGKHVAQQAAAVVKKTVLELGSNDAYVVLDDVDVSKAVQTCVRGRVYNNGEVCIAAKRFVVVDAVYDEFVEGFVERMQGVNFGDPMRDDVKMGPMARGDLRDTLHAQVEESVQKGARLLCGGEVPDGVGYFYPASVLVDVKPGMPAYDDELFGPVASIIRATDAEDAMRIANDSRFGLGGGILSGDEARAVELARLHFDTGMVFINGFGLASPNMPFGGVKDSGHGREHGGFGVREFVNVKAVVIK